MNHATCCFSFWKEEYPYHQESWQLLERPFLYLGKGQILIERWAHVQGWGTNFPGFTLS
ncbi:hypothetical protein D3C77_639920 [compost metagenome]